MIEKIRLSVDRETEQVLTRLQQAIEGQLAAAPEWAAAQEGSLSAMKSQLETLSTQLDAPLSTLKREIADASAAILTKLDAADRQRPLELQRIEDHVKAKVGEVLGAIAAAREAAPGALEGLRASLVEATVRSTEQARDVVLNAQQAQGTWLAEMEQRLGERLNAIDRPVSALSGLLDAQKSQAAWLAELEQRLGERFKTMAESQAQTNASLARLEVVTRRQADALERQERTLQALRRPWWKRIFGSAA